MENYSQKINIAPADFLTRWFFFWYIIDSQFLIPLFLDGIQDYNSAAGISRVTVIGDAITALNTELCGLATWKATHL